MQTSTRGSTAVAVPGRTEAVDAAGVAMGRVAEGSVARAARWWLEHWLRFAEVVGTQWR